MSQGPETRLRAGGGSDYEAPHQSFIPGGKAKETAMDSFELNKIIGAILGTLLFVMGVGFIAEAVYEPRENGPGLALPEPEGTHSEGATEEVAATPIGVLLASADPAAGQTAAKKCQSCHNFEQGAGNKTGPELFGVVGRVEGSHEGFAYSPVLLEHAAAGDVWSYENLNHFLTSPKDYAPGTKMNFSGLKNDSERANVIAYLASISPNAPAFPPAEAEAEAAAAPEGTEPVATDANAVATPTETQSETSVQGTPTTSGPDGAAPAATEAAPADAAPAATEAPAAAEPAPAAPADATAAPAAAPAAQ